MSKSLGNVVSVDEVTHGVAWLSPEYHFRDEFGDVIDHRSWGVWREPRTPNYYTANKFGKRPVILCITNDSDSEDIPPLFQGQVQHNRDKRIWLRLIEKYKDRDFD